MNTTKNNWESPESKELRQVRARLASVQEEADRRTREVEACYTVQRDLKARLAEAEALLRKWLDGSRMDAWDAHDAWQEVSAFLGEKP